MIPWQIYLAHVGLILCAGVLATGAWILSDKLEVAKYQKVIIRIAGIAFFLVVCANVGLTHWWVTH